MPIIKNSGKKLCRICKEPLPATGPHNQVVCINPVTEATGKRKLSRCQVLNRRRLSAERKGYIWSGNRFVKGDKLTEVECEICLESFVPDHPLQKIHISKVEGEKSACEKERQRRYSEKFRDDFKDQNGHQYQGSIPCPDADMQLRVCLGRLCTEQSNYPGELMFMSTGPYNRVCARCQDAEEQTRPNGRYIVNSDPGTVAKLPALVEL